MTIDPGSTPNFVRAVSLFAALEGASAATGANEALPYLGMARAELTDYGQRLLTNFVDIPVPSFCAGLVQLDELLTQMLISSTDLTHTLGLDSAQRLLREGIAAMSDAAGTS